MKKHLLALGDFTREELRGLIDRAIVLKKERKQGIRHQQLAGRTISLIFEKPSTRTRASYEAAMYSLGGQVIFMSTKDSQLGRGEPLKDTARVLNRYVDAIVIRTFGQEIVEELARYSSVPVINALTDLFHPCQLLSDMMTVLEKKGSLEHQQTAWIGDGNNMANALIQAAAIFGFPLRLACPEGFTPNQAVLDDALGRCTQPIEVVRDPAEAVKGADVINIDVWASMGQESEQQERMGVFKNYQLNAELLALAKKDAIVMHCLPAHRGEEVTEEVLEGPHSVIFDQAENKMHMHTAILEHFILGV